MENLYTDKTKKLNTSFTTYNNENGDIEVKTSKSIPKDKIQIKVRYDSPRAREELSGLAGLFHAKVVDVNLNSLILRVTGREDHVDALIKVLSPYDVLEIVRTGTISLSRGLVPVKEM